MYCLNMLSMALELAVHDPVYEDVATKFFEHFMYIGNAINNLGLWNAEVRESAHSDRIAARIKW